MLTSWTGGVKIQDGIEKCVFFRPRSPIILETVKFSRPNGVVSEDEWGLKGGTRRAAFWQWISVLMLVPFVSLLPNSASYPLWEICVSTGQPRPQPRRASPCTLPNFWTLPPAATKFHLTSQKRSNLGSLNLVHILILEKADVWLIFESDRLKVEVTRLESVSSAEICLGLQRNRTLFTFSRWRNHLCC